MRRTNVFVERESRIERRCWLIRTAVLSIRVPSPIPPPNEHQRKFYYPTFRTYPFDFPRIGTEQQFGVILEQEDGGALARHTACDD